MVGITNKTLIAEIRRQQQLSQSIVEGNSRVCEVSAGLHLRTKRSRQVSLVLYHLKRRRGTQLHLSLIGR